MDARDVAHASIRAISDGVHASRYIVASWQPLSAIGREVAAATGAPAPREVPAALAMAGTTVLEVAARLRRREPAVTREGTRVLLEGNHQHLTSARAEHELAATYRPLAQTITDEATWYRDHRLLPPAPASGQPTTPAARSVIAERPHRR